MIATASYIYDKIGCTESVALRNTEMLKQNDCGKAANALRRLLLNIIQKDFEMNELRITGFDMVAECMRKTELSEFVGNTFRGAFGESIVRNFCKIGDPSCTDCRHIQDCLYSRVYKTPTGLRGIKGTIPNPYVIKTPYLPNKRVYERGEEISFSVHLFGNASRFENDVLTAVNDMWREKLKDFRLLSYEKLDMTWSDEGKRLPTSSLHINFLTPTNITQLTGENDYDKFFYIFMETLFARISLILDLYGDDDFVIPYSLIGRQPEIFSRCNFRQKSIRQKGFSFSGIIGEATLSGDLSEYFPYISLGTMLHIGKMTTRGCGAYDVWIGCEKTINEK